MRTVLLVDDTALMRLVSRGLLESTGSFRVVGEAGDGEQALALADDLAPEVIVLDEQMPRLSGVQALPSLRARCPGSRIVMWSHDASARAGALQAGADAFVPKGAPAEALVAAVRGPGHGA